MRNFMMALAVGIGVLLLPAAVRAQTPEQTAQARALAKQATVDYQLGRFEPALRGYEQAFKLTKWPSLLFNIAQCHRQLGNLQRALFLYRSYLRASPEAPNRAQVDELIAEVKQKLESSGAPRVLPKPPAGPGEAAAAPAAPAPGRPGGDEDSPRPWYRRWYVWAAVGAVVVGGAVAGGVLAGRGGTGIPETPLGNQTLSFMPR